MLKNQNKSPVKLKSISFRKTPQDASTHLDFSITKKVIHHDNYESLVKKRRYEHRKADVLGIITTPDSEPAKEAAEEELEQAHTKEKGTENHMLPVRHDALSRSPYVVRLLNEWERTAHVLDEPKKSSPKKSRTDTREHDARWLKEVERLRNQVSYTKRKAQSITIDLLGKKGKAVKRKKKRERFVFSSVPAKIGAGILKVVIAILRWFFEFILSIPLGFLLAFTVLLTLVEVFNRGAVKTARAAGHGTSWAIQHTFFLIIAGVRATLVIPIKLITLACMAIYRTISSAGSFAIFTTHAFWEAVKNYALIFSNPPKQLYRKLAAVACIGIVVMLPVKFMEIAPDQIRLLKGSVLGATKQGYQGLASFDLVQAQGDFEQARTNIDSLNIAMRAMVLVLPAGQDGLHAITAGDELAKAGTYLAQAFEAQDVASENQGILPLLARVQESLSQSLPHLTAASKNLAAINADKVPDEFAEKFRSAQQLLPQISAAVAESSELFGTLADVLGANGDRRYVVLFQNNNELRPAGGFIGSLAFIDVRDGAITNIEVPGGGAYDFKGYLSEQVKAPKPLSLINSRWELQDANWYPDWKTSAEKVMWFLEHAGYSSVDGVIAVQATTLEKLLGITGPIEFPDYQVTLDENNVLNEIQNQVEFEYDKVENKPKQYIGELLPRVLEKLLSLNGNQMLSALELVKSEIKAKDILLYFTDEETNQAFIKRGWQPSLIASNGDYLSVVHANIGGGKTDGVIKESWDQEVVIDADGTVTVALTIIREHRGDPANQFERYNNVDYVRVYSPEGSELISFEGVKPPSSSLFKIGEAYLQEDTELAQIEGKVIIDEASGTRITNEFGKTVFGNWLQVNPGKVLVAKVRYKLPFKIKPFDLLNPNAKNGYSLIMQKQAGARAIPYSVSVRYPSDWLVPWQKAVGKGNVQVLGPGLVVFEGDLSEDTGFAVSFEK
ncbi:hypothetical protein BK004_04335 [bacterium CG10_46_32]|nr:MAG: hypothetical protein BK004_04335 [bacterium CG10_46_32]PIR55844.1 MAG: hypothetical protein COU73_04375 [Parcubacteria group bacterium CG10_big_fil_rev_8_21_14_0_10_46_32]